MLWHFVLVFFGKCYGTSCHCVRACLYAGSTLVVEWKRCAGRFDVLVGRLTCWLLEDMLLLRRRTDPIALLNIVSISLKNLKIHIEEWCSSMSKMNDMLKMLTR